jgi:putative hydrolase of the HAD superfamily
MAELETARITERAFLDRLETALYATTGRRLDLSGFRETWFAGRTTNDEFVAYLRTVRERGHQLALLTNNVVEWESLWRATIPADDLFGLIVNSADEGVRKPEPEIYSRTLDRLGLPADSCLFVDDVEENCAAGRRAGMPTVRFESTAQAIADIERWLAGDSGGA